jgi:hypothetical protein
MVHKSKRQAGTSSKKTRTAAKNSKRSATSLSRHDTPHRSVRRAPHWTQLTSAQQKQRIDGFEFLRLRRQGLNRKNAEKQSGIRQRMAEFLLPRAFSRNKGGQVQVRGYDPYVRKLKISTTEPGEFRLFRARGSHKASLVGTWSNAVKAAGHSDFSLIDAFPRNIVIDGVHLATSHDEVSRIAVAAAESDKPFEDIYDVVSAG